ncbi:carboxylesterase family protein [Streptomyces sp. NBC_00658]|uniref:carboxylesterase family protein n=1 Tax=Streptomyces sp. NBC_00658 TaxID=2975800 RepID=UPI0032526DFE
MITRALKQRVAAWTEDLVIPAMVLETLALTADPASKADLARSVPVVRTDGGLVRGVATTRADQFLGLPYAAPPLRELRFAPPATPIAWKGVHRADQQAPACIQFEPTGIREEQAVSNS